MGKSLLTPEGVEVTVLNLITGEQAWAIIQKANQFNEPPASGMQYVMVTVRVKNISSEKEPSEFTSANFELVGSSNMAFHSYDKAAVLPESGNSGKLRAELYRGGDAAGTVHFYIPRQESNLLLTWRGASGTRRFFEVKTVEGSEFAVTPVTPAPSRPSANFSASPVTGVRPLRVQFTDQSTGNITGWKWDFGDGSTSTLQNPSKTYESSGLYAVKLTISGPSGTGSTSSNIIVTDPIVTPTPTRPSTATPVPTPRPTPVPAIPDVSGNWHGTLAADFATEKDYWKWTMNLSQSGSRVTGTISIRGGLSGQYGTSPQAINGTISSAGRLSFAIGPSWRINLDATVTGDTLEGMYFATGTGQFGNNGTWRGTRP